ncbi:acyl carrier protein [Paenibacillus sp. SC116]|uniref:acyl carrier protein n=1 Tax=Paenibacillus sp. SC116 TaxID=2968986 RepID=UPI00215B40EB|nr:acyl carrier protein [Paenibacillus sp. SC116]MCR8843800.1 acyl carrier protein [Paenibacillus sp. SC116]
MEAQHKEKIRTFLAKFFKQVQLRDDDELFALGFVDSLFVMQLVTFLETEFEIMLDNEDLEFAHFRTIQSMSDLIGRKLATNKL